MSSQEAAKFLAQKMADELTAMPIDEAMPICRACGHYLNLTSIAETHHRYLQLLFLVVLCACSSAIRAILKKVCELLQCSDHKDAWYECQEL